ncbi:hypothetical protein CVT26_006810 [Gymnopilus dilepis]|uniref:JmjC domain-containing protein n=1 Tax=Gymnopilus dilepis TaxID=231916 RepID=A0A409Y348_9AGAR|nr:hypothetical protein CVT26_006810 [Gymnopilus dilepis]
MCTCKVLTWRSPPSVIALRSLNKARISMILSHILLITVWLSGPLQENLWLGDLRNEFQSEPISCVKANQEKVLQILQLLLDYPRPLSPMADPASSLFIGFGEAVAEKLINLKDVLQELKFSDNLQGTNHFTEEEDETQSGSKVAELLEEMLKRSWRHGDGLFSILNLPTPNISHYCRPKYPESLNSKRHTIYHLSLQKDQDTSWSTSMVPLTAVTSCYLDRWTMSIFHFHVAGKRLWLAWPPTKDNLRVYANWLKMHGGSLPVDVAITSLEGLEVLLVNENQVAWTFPPATLHAVITFSPAAAHIESYHTSACHFETAQLVASFLFQAFEGELLVSQSVMTIITRMLKEFRTADLACWEALGEMMDGHVFGLGSEILGWAGFMKERAVCLCEELEIASALIEE